MICKRSTKYSMRSRRQATRRARRGQNLTSSATGPISPATRRTSICPSTVATSSTSSSRSGTSSTSTRWSGQSFRASLKSRSLIGIYWTTLQAWWVTKSVRLMRLISSMPSKSAYSSIRWFPWRRRPTSQHCKKKPSRTPSSCEKCKKLLKRQTRTSESRITFSIWSSTSTAWTKINKMRSQQPARLTQPLAWISYSVLVKMCPCPLQRQLRYLDPAQVLWEVLVMEVEVAELLLSWTQCFIPRTCSRMPVICRSSNSSKCFTKRLPEECKIVVKVPEEQG